MRVIAIDGPAGSGKSTAARRLAETLGFTHLNTGAMYRAVAFLAQEHGIPLTDEVQVAEVARGMKFDYRIVDGQQRFIVNGEDRSRELFTAALTAELKPVVNNTTVREILVNKMRTAASAFLATGAKGVVMEGRDIGTVVFPDAAVKFYVHADLDARTRRRATEFLSRNEQCNYEGLKQQLRKRDEADEARAVGPLARAADAIDVDTTHLDVQATQDLLLHEIRARKLA